MAEIKLHRAQSEIINDLFGPNPNWQTRFEVVVGSRGLGKSYVAGAAVAMAAAELETLRPDCPNKTISLLCGTHEQVKQIFIPILQETFGFRDRAYKFIESTGRWHFRNGTVVQCRSAEAVQRLRGTGQYLVVMDELPTWSIPNLDHADAWESIIAPTITTRWSPQRARELGAPSPGRALIIASPINMDYFYELSLREVTDPRWKTRQYTYKDSPLLDAREIEMEKLSMDPLRFRREYLASFEDSGARVFYMFDRREHVLTDIEPPQPYETIHASIDFNIMKNCTAFHVIRGGQVFTIGEIEGTANTEELAGYIKTRWKGHKVLCYPDPSGSRRVSSAPVGTTDFSILKNAGFEVLARHKAPPIVDSVNAVNRMFRNANDQKNWYISHECKGVIKSLERTSWLESRPDSATIDKSLDVEHYSDGIRYFAEYNWPVNHVTNRVSRGFSF
jgi:hypothetical protein